MREANDDQLRAEWRGDLEALGEQLETIASDIDAHGSPAIASRVYRARRELNTAVVDLDGE